MEKGALRSGATMAAVISAAKTKTVFPLAAFFHLTENSRLGHQLPTAELYPGAGLAISNTASGLQAFLYDERRRSRCSGQDRDPETASQNSLAGLDWFRARYMSSAQGRFQSVDPGNAGANPGDPQSWNAYSYVGNNPLSYTDPSGESWFSIFAGVVAGLVTGNPAVGGLVYGAFTSLENVANGQPPLVFGSSFNSGDLFGCGGPLGNCKTLGSNPWSENSGLGSVRDPDRFIMDYNSAAHGTMTVGAAINAGWSIDDAMSFAGSVQGVDFWRGSQRHDPMHEHWHATAAPGESCTAAYAGAIGTVRDATARAQAGDRSAAALALHTIEDSYAAGHQYKIYSGGVIPSRAHRRADETGASGYSDAQAAATRYLDGTMQSPESYLFRPTNCRLGRREQDDNIGRSHAIHNRSLVVDIDSVFAAVRVMGRNISPYPGLVGPCPAAAPEPF